MPLPVPTRPRSALWAIVLLWVAFYASVTIVTPPLLDDADSVHAEVAREMLLRHDYITLHANGIRYLEKAPLFYWAMAAGMRLAQLTRHSSPQALAIAARIPLALAVLALALLCEALARRMFGSAYAGLYAALITLSSCGIFLFTRMLIPDAMVCLWIAFALYCFWCTEGPNTFSPAPATDLSSRPEPLSDPERSEGESKGRSGETRISLRSNCWLFAAACALNVLTKGLIGIVFPVGIVLLYLVFTRGLRGTFGRLRQLHPLTSALVFIAIAAPWHILAGLANPTQGRPAPFIYTSGHWIVPLPTDGNVRGWTWFYFMNEHLLRYLNLRVPHDYDTAPLWLFWGLCLVWLMPFSAFLLGALGAPLRQWAAAITVRLRTPARLRPLYQPDIAGPRLLLVLWAALPLLFFSLSTRQEYYVLPSLPALAVLIAGWLCACAEPQKNSSCQHGPPLDLSSRPEPRSGEVERPALSSDFWLRCLSLPLLFGTAILITSLLFLWHSPAPDPHTDLASLLTQNAADYALSLGHAMDLTGPAVALFRAPLLIAALSLSLGPLAALFLRRRARAHAANLSLAAGAFGFLIAVAWGLNIFSPVLTSAQLAEAIAPQVRPQDMVAIHGEYESGSTLGFYLQRPGAVSTPSSDQYIHIVDGRSSNLWYGSFFPDAPPIFETDASLAQKWRGPQRIFLWQSLTDPPNQLPPLPGPVYILVKSGGKEIVSNQPNR